MPYRASTAAEELTHKRTSALDAHRHRFAYIALVLDGAYDEASADGRFFCPAGTLIIHPTLHAHANAISGDGARTLNFLLPPDRPEFAGYAVYTSPDVQEFARAAWRSPREAIEALSALRKTNAPAQAPPAWCRDLANALRQGERAIPVAVSREHACRSFRRHFAMSPSSYRAEWRLRRALELIRRGEPLSQAAMGAGFADQSHMTRDVVRLTGATPGCHRRAVS
jgi:AraC family transcriptional regulator